MTLTGIPGGRAAERIGRIDVERERSGEESSAVDAVVLEEDRYLLLTAKTRLLEDKNPLRTLTNGYGSERAELGTLVLRQGRPLTMLAIVIDVDADPPVQPEHVRRAIDRALAVCVAQACARLRVPLLGRHGRLPTAQSASILRDALAAHTGAWPRQVIVSLLPDQEF